MGKTIDTFDRLKLQQLQNIATVLSQKNYASDTASNTCRFIDADFWWSLVWKLPNGITKSLNKDA